MTLNALIDNTTPTLIFGTVVTDTDEVKDVFDKKKNKMVKKRVRGSKTTRVYAKVASNRKIGGGKVDGGDNNKGGPFKG
jgi:hypothetical protein